jgi:hypothetical protein
VLWLFCSCWSKPEPVRLVFTIWLQQTKFYENEILCSCGNETSVGYDREKENIGFFPNVLTQFFYYLVQVGLGRFAWTSLTTRLCNQPKIQIKHLHNNKHSIFTT